MATLHVRNVPEELYDRLRQQAGARSRSLSAEVIQLLEAALGEGDQDRPAPPTETRRRRSSGAGRTSGQDDPGLLRDDRARYQLDETLGVPPEVLDRARSYAERHDTSLARLVTEYLRRLEPDDQLAAAPVVRRLAGTLSPEVTTADHHRYLEEKYGYGPGRV